MDDLLTTREAAAALGLSEQEIRRLVGAARLDARRFSRNLILLPRAEVERYRAERRPRGRPRNAAPAGQAD